MDTVLIEKLARLRGIGDAYHDYRGELQYFNLQTKAGILRAMGCTVDDDAALAAEIRKLESEYRLKLVPALHAFRDARTAVEINVAARVFGAVLQWSVKFEDGTRRSGTARSSGSTGPGCRAAPPARVDPTCEQAYAFPPFWWGIFGARHSRFMNVIT